MMTDIERIRAALQFVPVGGHDERVRVAFMLKSELGEAGRDLWHEWRGERGDDEAASVWKSASETGPLKIGTLFHEAKANGWRDDGRYQKPTPEELAERRRIAAERAAQEEAAIARERAGTAQKAAAILKAATEAKADHPYLSRKRVSPVATLREIDAGKAAAILGYPPKSGGDQLAGRLLVVPVKQGGKLATVELIDGDKRKAALAGRGSKAGGYWATERLPDGDGAGLTLLIGEGAATVLSASAATGCPAVAALSSGNLPAVAKAMRERYPAAALVILADLVKATGAPDPHAIEAARAVGGKLAIPDFGTGRDPDTKDMNDLFILGGAEAVARAIAGASAPPKGEHQPGDGGAQGAAQGDEANIIRLAGLSPLDYDRIRKAEAESMGVRPATLDKLVVAARKDEANGSIDFDEVEAWPHPIAPALLLAEIASTVKRFIVCEEQTAVATALWATLTWFIDDVQVAPLAVITAPEKRCGKTQLLSLLRRIVFRPLAASNVSSAALFRAVDAWKPTLLVDEADAFMRENEELRGILNAGHTRDSAYVVRVVGEDLNPQRFNVWGCKALAGIGHLADTLMDRAIVLELRRKLAHEQTERLRHAEPGLFDDLAAKLARFADDYREAIRKARPTLPSELHDRAQDNWEPLLAIADVAGGEWPELARSAALKLSGSESPTMTVGTELLADVKAAFETKQVDRLSTADLIETLCADPEAPWATYNRGKPISPRQVSRRLADYGIASNTIRVGLNTPKGYMRSAFEEAFSRYLPPPLQAQQSATPPQTSQGAGLRVAEPEHVAAISATKNLSASEERCGGVADTRHVAATEKLSATPKPASEGRCGGVADTRGDSGSVDIVEEFF